MGQYTYSCKIVKKNSHVGLLFTNEEQKRLAHDLIHTSATHSSPVHGATDCRLKMAALSAMLLQNSNVSFSQARL